MQCVVLAGGLGTRMQPYTETLPKSLIPVGGRPFLDHKLEWLAKVGVTDIVLCVGYRGEALRDHVGDGGRWGLNVKVVFDGHELRGTAGALRVALEAGALEEAFLVTYGDSFLPVDHSSVWAAFLACGKPALMTVFRNRGRWDQSNASLEGGLVYYDKQHRTRAKESFDYIDYGLVALQRSLISEKVPERGRADLSILFHELGVSGHLAGMEVHQRFYEIGSHEGLLEFERWLLQKG